MIDKIQGSVVRSVLESLMTIQKWLPFEAVGWSLALS